MFIYFLEQVWHDASNPYDWSQLNWETHKTQARYWDWWHAEGYKHYSVYPMSHMEHGNDYFDY